MAEFADVNNEDMLPELERLKKLRILTQAEIRKIVKSRRNFQFKINKRAKSVDDYVRYIQYEKDLLTFVKARRKKMGIGNDDSEIDMTIAYHINKLFKQAIFQFRDDINLWVSYMMFCKQVKVFSVCVSYMLGGMLAIHGHKPSLWKLAASWEFEENKSIENARQFLLRGLRHHPDSKILYTEAFRLELTHAEIRRKQMEAREMECNQEVKQSTSTAPQEVTIVPVHIVPIEIEHTDPTMVHHNFEGHHHHHHQHHHHQHQYHHHCPQGHIIPPQEIDPAMMAHGVCRNDDAVDMYPIPITVHQGTMIFSAMGHSFWTYSLASQINRRNTQLAQKRAAKIRRQDHCRAAEFIYQSALDKIRDVHFLIGLLHVAKEFHFTENLQARMVKDMLVRYPNDESTWDAVARSELGGLHIFYDRASVPDDLPEYRDDMYEDIESKIGPPSKSEIERMEYVRIRRCFTIYQQGLRHIASDRMWSFYLDALIEINQDVSVLRKCKRKLLYSTFRTAHEMGRLEEKYYIQWVNFHSGQREELGYLLRVATEKYPSSVELWRMRLRFHLCEDEEQNAMAVFKGAIACLHRDPASTLCLWKMLIQYCQTKSAAKVTAIFFEGIRQPPAVSSVLKQMFLEWLVLTKDINAARKAYQLMCGQPPFCRELYQKMASLECLQPEVELPRVIKCCELACEQMGNNTRPEEYYCNVSSSKMAL